MHVVMVSYMYLSMPFPYGVNLLGFPLTPFPIMSCLYLHVYIYMYGTTERESNVLDWNICFIMYGTTEQREQLQLSSFVIFQCFNLSHWTDVMKCFNASLHMMIRDSKESTRSN